MAIRITGFGDKAGTALRKTLELVISKKSEAIILEKKVEILADLQMTAKRWQAEVREKLSKKVQGTYGTASYVRNTDLWPRMQQGRLVAAVKAPKVKANYKPNTRQLAKNQLQFTISGFYGGRIETIGVQLDQMQNHDGSAKTFSNWLTRANAIWYELMGNMLPGKVKNFGIKG